MKYLVILLLSVTFIQAAIISPDTVTSQAANYADGGDSLWNDGNIANTTPRILVYFSPGPVFSFAFDKAWDMTAFILHNGWNGAGCEITGFNLDFYNLQGRQQ